MTSYRLPGRQVQEGPHWPLVSNGLDRGPAVLAQVGQLAAPETSLLVKIRKDISHIKESPFLLPDGQEVGQGGPLQELDVEVDNAIKSCWEQLVPASFRFEDMAKLSHVGRELVHGHKVQHGRDPDLL